MKNNTRGESRAATTSKMERLPPVNCYHRPLHLGCYSSPRSASEHYPPIKYYIYRIKPYKHNRKYYLYLKESFKYKKKVSILEREVL